MEGGVNKSGIYTTLWPTAYVILQKLSTSTSYTLQSLFVWHHVILKHIVWKSCISDEWRSPGVILNPFIKFDSFEAVILNLCYVCFEFCSKPAETCCLRCLEERLEVLLKVDSVTEFKNIFQDIYKDTRLTLIETVLLCFLWLTLTMVLFAEALLEEPPRGFTKK